jgi:hypothetical protein
MMPMRNSAQYLPTLFSDDGSSDPEEILLVIRKPGAYRVEEIDPRLARYYERTRPQGRAILLSRSVLWIEPRIGVAG